MEEQGISQEGFATLDETNAVEQNEQLTLFSLQELAVNTTRTIERVQEELKTAQEMLKDAYENNATYKEKKEALKEPTQALKGVKTELSRLPEMIALSDKVKELKNEVKEKRQSVSEYALEVYRLTGNNEFERDGSRYEIRTVAKLVKVKE